MSIRNSLPALMLASRSLCRPRGSISLRSQFIHTPARSRCWSRRSLSNAVHAPNDLFDYTTGRRIYNDALRLAERRRVFDVDGLRRLAAESVGRSPDDVVGFAKLAEGGFNRTFLITMCDGFQMVARIPYPLTNPKYHLVASEVATMSLLRSSGLPIPEVYGYSPSPDNAAETEYIFMEFVRGVELISVWDELEERDIVSIMRQLVRMESTMMSITFPAGGCLYYARDLEVLDGVPGIPLEDKRYCVGPDVRPPLWFGRRAQLDVDRGPYESAEAALVTGAHKELAYLKQFGQPLLPFSRFRRQHYGYREQSPADHVENLNRYLLLAPSLVPKDPGLTRFCIRHPDLQPNNIMVSQTPDHGWEVTGVLDWQHASILPAFLLAGIPDRFQNHNDPFSQYMLPPPPPKNVAALDEPKQREAEELYRRRLVHYHYVKSTEQCNEHHYAALTDPAGALRSRLICSASDPWEGETLQLKTALIRATENWEALAGAGDVPCPVAFDAEDVRQTKELDEKISESDQILRKCMSIIDVVSEGWVPSEHFEAVMARSALLREQAVAATESAEERAEISAHWPFDDMDEEKYT